MQERRIDDDHVHKWKEGSKVWQKNLQLDATNGPEQKPLFTNELVHFDSRLQ